MKKVHSMTRCKGIVILVLFILMMFPSISQGAMNDYCVVPPFIVGGVTPNLLLMVDNSASMFDLTYVDKGGIVCSGDNSQYCQDDAECEATGKGTCSVELRRGHYCYDQTYNSANTYVGYFEAEEIYEYDFANDYFSTAVAIGGCAAGEEVYLIPSTLLVCVDTGALLPGDEQVTKFIAKGSYLNWLTASKFDVQKMILTGGKYQAPLMIAESRGCVGRKFIKEPITADYQEYSDPGPNPNTSLGITFGIRGPKHPYSETMISIGGTTEIDIFYGDYDDEQCNDAINAVRDGENKQTQLDAIQLCLDYDQGKHCSLDDSISCNNDADCGGEAGKCDITNDGICGIINDGVCTVTDPGTCTLKDNGSCTVTTGGVCTIDNGNCSAGKVCVGGADDGNPCTNKNQCDSEVCSKVCIGGGKAGAECNNDNDCQFSSCTAGKIGSLCSVDTDCDLKTCTAPDPGITLGNVCFVDSDCNTKECAAGSIGDACAVDTDCDVKECTAPDPGPTLGNACNVNTDCNSAAGACTDPIGRFGDPCVVDTDCNSAPGSCTVGKVGDVCLVDTDCDTNFGVCQQPVTQQIKSTFSQSVHECYQFRLNGDSFVGNDYLNLIANPSGCNQIYKEYKICSGGSKDGQACDPGDVCPGAGAVCINGPGAIRPGSAAYVCSLAYTGYCAESFDNWDTTNWVPREYADWEECVTEKFAAFCTGVDQPPVTDPSDDPSTTEEFDNLPAIIADLGVETQLGPPIGSLTVNIASPSEPTGLIQEFEDLIHFGAMTFNYFGSDTECPADVPCTKICQGIGTTCVSDMDCPSVPCVDAANLDGSIIGAGGYIQGNCSITVATTCTNDLDCPAGEACIYSVGDHTSGLIRDVDDIFASTWTPFAEAFNNAIGYFAQRIDIRENAADYITEAENPDYHDPIQYKCQKNNILLISDGMSTTDQNLNVNTLASLYNDGDGQIGYDAANSCPKFAGSRNIDDLAWLAKNRNIKDFNETPLATDPEINSKTLTTHVVFNGVATGDPGECDPDELMRETADNGDGTYQRAENPEDLRDALREAFLAIAGRAASGTAASVLASGEGTGANLVQAIFYPERSFAGEEILWTGSLKNLWYYIDPLLGNSSIREDTVEDKNLIITDSDYIVHFFFCNSANGCAENDNLTKAELFEDVDGDGVADDINNPVDVVYFENVKSLWEAGGQLWAKTAGDGTGAGDRNIFTTTDGSTETAFIPGNAAALKDLLQAASDAEASQIISYARGYDKFCSVTISQICDVDGDCPLGETCESLRSRTVIHDLNGDGDTLDIVDGIQENIPRVWKLGDIINSTPRIVSWVPLNAYDDAYNDTTYEDFTDLPTYTDRGMVFVGANDGMLHAFNLGKLELFEERDKKAALSGTSLGEEEWAFIPMNALPYLKYISDPGYCHLFLVDLTPYILDASIACNQADYWNCTKDENSWKTVIIGGMRIGGACKNVCGSTYCVETPVANEGYSSYFAIDITDPSNPNLLWEFSDQSLGYSTTGPAVVKISALTGGSSDNTKNGRWYVVIGSGPTGPIDTNTHQFKGYSDQSLKLFILDLKTGQLLRTIDSGINYAFAGSMVESSIDYDQHDRASDSWYQDDALYFGYVKAEDDPPVATTRWNSGGVLRLTTKNGIDPATAQDQWVLSKLIETGPVTSAVAKLQNYGSNPPNPRAFMFFGTGRYYFKISDVIDDATSRRTIFGVKEPCYVAGGFDDTCTDTVNLADLGDATLGASADPDGWYILLDQCTDAQVPPVEYANCADPNVKFMTERVVTDTLSTPIGAVFFTTTKPSSDVCEFGGTSHLWAVDWGTGGAVNPSVLRGRAILQVSTGSIEEVELKTAFTEKGGRRTTGVQGVPPAGTPPGILVPPEPTNKFIHIFEK